MMLLFQTQSVFLYRAPSIGGETSCPIHRNSAVTGPAYTSAKNAKKGGVTLKLFYFFSHHLKILLWGPFGGNRTGGSAPKPV